MKASRLPHVIVQLQATWITQLCNTTSMWRVFTADCLRLAELAVVASASNNMTMRPLFVDPLSLLAPSFSGLMVTWMHSYCMFFCLVFVESSNWTRLRLSGNQSQIIWGSRSIITTHTVKIQSKVLGFYTSISNDSKWEPLFRERLWFRWASSFFDECKKERMQQNLPLGFVKNE